MQAAIVAGAGVRPVDSNGNPWQGSYVTASGNLLADFTADANAEMQGRIQVARIYTMTDDKGVRDMLSFLLARDTMHQNQWIRAAQELRGEGVEDLSVPSNFPLSNEAREHAYTYINFSDGQAAAEGSWASGPTPDGKGEFTYLDAPDTSVPIPPPTQPDPRFFRHGRQPELHRQGRGRHPRQALLTGERHRDATATIDEPRNERSGAPGQTPAHRGRRPLRTSLSPDPGHHPDRHVDGEYRLRRHRHVRRRSGAVCDRCSGPHRDRRARRCCGRRLGSAGPGDAGEGTVVGLAAVRVSGWLGGKLAYRWGVRVADEGTRAEGFTRGR